MQIEVAWFFGTPAFTWSAGPSLSLLYYLPAEPFGLVLPNMFLGLSISLAVFGVGSTYLMNRRRAMSTRLNMLVEIFAVIVVGVSSLVVSWRSTHVKDLRESTESMEA